jgi:hypothetical protein
VSRRRSKNSRGGTTKPAEEIEIGSIITAATVSGSSAWIVFSTISAQVMPQSASYRFPYGQR